MQTLIELPSDFVQFKRQEAALAYANYVSNNGNVVIAFSDQIPTTVYDMLVETLDMIQSSSFAGDYFGSPNYITISIGDKSEFDPSINSLTLSLFSNYAYFNLTNGGLSYESLQSVFVHELTHGLVGTNDIIDVNGDPIPPEDPLLLQKMELLLADPNSDFIGQTVRMTNSVMKEISGPVERGHYFNNGAGAESLEGITTGGEPIDAVITGRLSAPSDFVINRTTSTHLGSPERALVIGGAGNETIRTGAGRDFIYAGAGDDRLNGSLQSPLNPTDDKEADQLEGGDDYDTYEIYGNFSDYSSNSRERFYSSSWSDRGTAWYIYSLKFIDTAYDSDGSGVIEARFDLFGQTFSETIQLDVYEDFVPVPGDGRPNVVYNAYEALGEGTGTWTVDSGAATSAVFIKARNIHGFESEYAIIQAGYGTPSPSTHNPFVAIEISRETSFSRQSGDKIYFVGTGIADVVNGDIGDDEIYGENGNDVLSGGDGSDYLDGGAGNDILYGGGGYDVLLGGAGDDLIYGGSGNDLLDARVGADELHGGDGDDMVFIDADDTAYTGGDGYDTLVFTGSTNFVYSLAGSSFEELNSGSGDDTLTADISGSTINAGDADDILIGAAGDDILSGENGDDIIDGKGGDDYLYGDAGSDVYRYSVGDGSDSIDDWGNAGDLDTLQFLDAIITDLTFERDGDDLKITVNSTGHVLLVSEQFADDSDQSGLEEIKFADDTLMNRAAILNAVDNGNPPGAIVGTSADDTLYGTSGDDIFIGGLGTDILISGPGSDTYIYASGDGNDYIDDESGSTTDIDILKFTDLNLSDVTFSFDPINHLFVTVNSTSEAVTLDEQFYAAAEGWGLERVEFANGMSIDLAHSKNEAWTYRGTDANDSLTAAIWGQEDIFIGGKGNDYMNGEAGGDVYIYSSGDGNDIIDDEAGFTNNTDVLIFTDLNATDVNFSQSGVDLLIEILGTGEVITIDEQFYSADYWGTEEIRFADNSVLNRSDILALV